MPHKKAPLLSTVTGITSLRVSLTMRLRMLLGRGAMLVTSHQEFWRVSGSNPSDILVDLIYSLKAGYRQNGVFVMNRKTQSAIRKFKDATGNYLWQPPAVAGGKATLMTFPVIEAEDMPDITANSFSIAFGDIPSWLLGRRQSWRECIARPYTAKPYVTFTPPNV